MIPCQKKIYSLFPCRLMARALYSLSTLMQLLFSFDQDMRVEKILMQTLASQLSSTLMQLLFSFDQEMRVEKTLIQTLTCQLSSTLMQLLFSFDQDMRVEKSLIQTLTSQLPPTLMRLLFSFDQEMSFKKILIYTLTFQLSCNSRSKETLPKNSENIYHNCKKITFFLPSGLENL